jgi:hypothetical protein
MQVFPLQSKDQGHRFESPIGFSGDCSSENLKEASIILKNLAGLILKEYDAPRLSRQFIGLINSFSFDCKSRPNRITGLPANVRRGRWATVQQLVSWSKSSSSKEEKS